MQINVKEMYFLVIDNDKKRREQEPAPLSDINGKLLQMMDFDKCSDIWILGHGKRQYESNQGSGQANDHCSTWPDQMPSASNGIFHKQRYGSLLLLSGTHWVVRKRNERRETIVFPSLQERLPSRPWPSHGRRQVLPLSSRKHKQVSMQSDACDMKI